MTDTWVPQQLREHRPKWMRPREIVGAVGADDRHPTTVEVSREIAEQIAGRGIGPVKIFEYHTDAASSARTIEQPANRLEHPQLRPTTDCDGLAIAIAIARK